jgi:hypothetical protein
MHAQTILQLYRQLLEANYGEQELALVRAAYDLSRQLFVGSYRPSEKPFCAHLVGTASALVRWGERPEMVAAGMLHGAYLFGEFGDRTRGACPAKRQALITRVGMPTEALVDQYSLLTTAATLSDLQQWANDPQRRDVVVLKLADLLDDCADAGPLFSPHKVYANGLPYDPESRHQVLALVQALIGEKAEDDFTRVLNDIDALKVPAVLANRKQASYMANPGLPELRISNTRRRIRRLAKRFSIR